MKDESAENEDPALKTLSQVFKSLFNSNSSSSDQGTSSKSEPGTSASANVNPMGPLFGQQLPNEFMTFLQGLSPLFMGKEGSADLEKLALSNQILSQQQTNTADSEFSPFKLLKLLEPLINENVVKETQRVYEFHIRCKSNDNYTEDKNEVFYLDLKHSPKGAIGIGTSIYGNADCIIRLSDEDLKELLMDELKPFTAYMSGRIEIEGDLQDVFKLKKLIKSITKTLSVKKFKNLIH